MIMAIKGNLCVLYSSNILNKTISMMNFRISISIIDRQNLMKLWKIRRNYIMSNKKLKKEDSSEIYCICSGYIRMS